MVEPLRHRQTKEADNRYVWPTATAPHLDFTKTGNAQNKQMLSALPPLATEERTLRIGSFVPGGDITTQLLDHLVGGFAPAHGSRDARYATIARRSCSSRLATTWAINGLHSPARAPCWKS